MLIASAGRGLTGPAAFWLAAGAQVHARRGAAVKKAVSHNRLQMVKFLARKGADLHTDQGVLLRIAAAQGYEALARYLMEEKRLSPILVARETLAIIRMRDDKKMLRLLEEMRGRYGVTDILPINIVRQQDCHEAPDGDWIDGFIEWKSIPRIPVS